ncbi:hypothetical protein NQ176_g1893 [Zarea fungicola]|uniref:Uncharacterized protein n=1 Tax=Zarea fungicola TaxID=93591 RepID=A0ACC1NRA4_9HYPO|nr:hypothetical protein NQ176_g1893 [Lecanicillium fungicola]
MSFSKCPNEIILAVADELDIFSVNRLMRTCRRYHSLLDDYLYRRDAKGDCLALEVLCEYYVYCFHLFEPIATKSLAAGADVNKTWAYHHFLDCGDGPDEYELEGRSTPLCKQAGLFGEVPAASPWSGAQTGAPLPRGEPQRNQVGVWDACTGALLGRVKSHADEVALAAFMPDGNLVTGSRDSTLRITNPATGRTIAKLEIEGHGAGYPRALIVADDSTIVSIWGSTVYIWFPYASQLVSDNRSSVRRTEGVPLAISTDGKFMLCRNEDGFDIMDILTGATVAECPGGGTLVTSAAFSVDGSMVLLGRVGGFLEVWDIIKNDS